MAEYRILGGPSEVVVSARSSVHPIQGVAAEVSGDVDIVIADGRVQDLKKGRIEVPIDQLRSANVLYDAELQRRVDSRRHPLIVGEVRAASQVNDDGMFEVKGDVSFHGVTRPVTGTLTAQLSDGGNVVIEGSHTFDVREFEIQPPRILMLRVYPEVTVEVCLVAQPVD